ncbi:hypothetical protein SynBMKMC1_02273 [Synechococcus sp. BMK-MC-1]|nr:hypothetical protein SynBMKMC1_02273 [Synechococcus sp. BMK-MC-1]
MLLIVASVGNWLSKIRLTSYWAVPITTSEQASLSVNHETFTAWRCSDRFDGMAFEEFFLDRSHGSRIR